MEKQKIYLVHGRLNGKRPCIEGVVERGIDGNGNILLWVYAKDEEELNKKLKELESYKIKV